MTELATQVIDTLVEWIDENLHQPLRIDEIARRRGIQNGICSVCFYSIKGEPWALHPPA